MDIDQLVFASQFEPADEAHINIRNLAAEKGIYPASIQALYQAIGRGEINGFTVPAINIRTLTYDFAQVIFKLMMEHKVGPVIFEIAISEQEYTSQNPSQFASSILAAAIKTGYSGPVFMQGDHYQFRREKYFESKAAELERIKTHIRNSIEAGFLNIDIDGSTLVDLEKSDLHEQQRENYTVTAAMTEYIRSLQPAGTTISVGGEIGHIGGKNSSVEDFKAFMKGYLALLSPGTAGISKVSVQTGTHHGGVMKADGSMEEAHVDFSVLKSVGQTARSQFGMGGAVQHGASTLPDELFHTFPENHTLEIHLSTGFQNIVFDTMPAELREKIYATLQTQDPQEIYAQRKKALGPFKKELWELPDKQPILSALHDKVRTLFNELNVCNTEHYIRHYYENH